MKVSFSTIKPGSSRVESFKWSAKFIFSIFSPKELKSNSKYIIYYISSVAYNDGNGDF